MFPISEWTVSETVWFPKTALLVMYSLVSHIFCAIKKKNPSKHHYLLQHTLCASHGCALEGDRYPQNYNYESQCRCLWDFCKVWRRPLQNQTSKSEHQLADAIHTLLWKYQCAQQQIAISCDQDEFQQTHQLLYNIPRDWKFNWRS